ncbi:glycine C-acetyltransferase [Microbacterium sp. MC2]
MTGILAGQARAELQDIDAAGLRKRERAIETSQSGSIRSGGSVVLNFCANNYLGLADDPAITRAAADALEQWGFGMASVRFICGTQQPHLELERELAEFLGTDQTILFPSCFDANTGTFEVLFGAEDAIISDELNHASLIDGIRLSKAKRFRYRNRDMDDLERQLIAAAGSRRIVIVTDGVFSMDGYLAPLDRICDLAERHGATVMVDDSHAVGFVGPGGRGTPALFGVSDRVSLLTGTLGKALGGGSGGYVAGDADVIELLRQRARPYLFSNSVPPPMVGGARAALRIAAGSDDARERLTQRAAQFRERMVAEGFDLLPGEHPIVPVLMPDARTATAVADHMLSLGVYVIAFSFPVVPRESPRIRVQISAVHTEDDVNTCVTAFVAARAAVTG